MPHEAGATAQLRKNFAFILVANAGYAATQLIILVAISRWTTLADVGYYGFGLALTTPLVLVTSMSLREVALTDASRQFAAATYIRLRYLTAAIALAATMIIAGVVVDSSVEFATIGAIGIVKTIEALCEVRYGLLQRNDNHFAVARSMAIRAIVGTAVFLVCLRFSRQVAPSLLAMSVTWFLLYRQLDCAAQPAEARSPGDTPEQATRRYSIQALAAIAWPMGIVAATVSLQLNVPRAFVRAYLGTETLGRFTAITAVLAITSTVLVALGQTSGPSLASLWLARAYRKFALLTAKLIGMMLLLAGVGILLALTAGDWMIIQVFGSAYRGLDGLLAQICLAAGLFGISGILGTAALALRAFRLVSVLQIVAALLTICISWLLIPYGLQAAGWALVAAAGVSCLPPIGAFIRARQTMAVTHD